MYLSCKMRRYARLLSFLSFALALLSAPSITAKQLCESVYLKRPVELRALSQIPRLRLMTYNLENFSYDRLDPAKVQKAKAIGGIIRSERPDVIVLQEISNRESLQNFNREELGGRYRVIFIEGGRDNAQHLSFLIKKSLDLRYELRSHRSEMWFDPVQKIEEPLFKRDFPALILLEPGATAYRPAMIIFGNHGKSMKDRPGDPESAILRAAQVEGMQNIAWRYRNEFGPEVPMIIAGDFNINLAQKKLISPLRKIFEDAFNFNPVPRDSSERVTHTYHGRGQLDTVELDAFFVTRTLRHHIKSVRVFRYRDQEGNLLPLAETREERDLQPSDHFPVILDISSAPVLASSAP